ncbi:MAG: hypothetical protein JWM98_671 [Thermoleophilia bacterium]|nr:hypothetical protein [Thermoleophilia bacterium]
MVKHASDVPLRRNDVTQSVPPQEEGSPERRNDVEQSEPSQYSVVGLVVERRKDVVHVEPFDAVVNPVGGAVDVAALAEPAKARQMAADASATSARRLVWIDMVLCSP